MNALKSILLVPFAALALASAVQAAPIQHTIMLSAQIPTTDFYVAPAQTGWIGNVQKLEFNVVTRELQPFVKEFEVKNASAAINAQLISTPRLLGSGNNIDLGVKFNGATLTTTSAEVVDDATAAGGSKVLLEIIPTKPSGGYVEGDYAGNVEILFESA